MKFRARYVLLVYVICVGTVTLVWNRLEDNVIQYWYTHGGGKLRGSTAFASFATVLGIWVYPFAVICAFLFLRQALSESTARGKFACIARAAVCLALLLAFVILGVGGFVRGWS